MCRKSNLMCLRDLKQVKDSRNHFDKISSDLDTALSRHAQAPKNSAKNQVISASGSTNSALTTAALSSSQGRSSSPLISVFLRYLISDNVRGLRKDIKLIYIFVGRLVDQYWSGRNSQCVDCYAQLLPLHGLGSFIHYKFSAVQETP